MVLTAEMYLSASLELMAQLSCYHLGRFDRSIIHDRSSYPP
uniref:Uncharacterized protein n=1 Tax=Anguilla anguilla TaxID=7936 RepID=A0A0E9QBV7_ANGAN